MRHRRTHRVERAPEVGGHRLLEVADGHVLERPHLDHAGVVDEHIESTVAIDGFADDAGGLGLARDVGDDCRRIDAALSQFLSS